jgi:hypothetical protein
MHGSEVLKALTDAEPNLVLTCYDDNVNLMKRQNL